MKSELAVALELMRVGPPDQGGAYPYLPAPGNVQGAAVLVASSLLDHGLPAGLDAIEQLVRAIANDLDPPRDAGCAWRVRQVEATSPAAAFRCVVPCAEPVGGLLRVASISRQSAPSRADEPCACPVAATSSGRHDACLCRAMQHSTWTAPQFEELNLGSEIGTYYEEEDDPSFLMSRTTIARRRPFALQRRMQRTQSA